jgi:cytosine deaminase
VIVSEARTFEGGAEWPRQAGVEVVVLDSSECVEPLEAFIARRPDGCDEDIGE